jgi:DNA-binding MarR family transcriptional regulator
VSRDLELQRFLPYRLNRLAAEISEELSGIYAERFGLDVPEWRVLATLGAGEPVTAQAIVASTRTHKSTISRAIARLLEIGLIERIASPADGRERLLRFTAKGRKVYGEVAPLALDYEAELLARLPEDRRAALLAGLAALERALGLYTPEDRADSLAAE